MMGLCNDGSGIWIGDTETPPSGNVPEHGTEDPPESGQDDGTIGGEDDAFGADDDPGDAVKGEPGRSDDLDRFDRCLRAWEEARACFALRPSPEPGRPAEPGAPEEAVTPAPQARPITVADLIRLAPGGAGVGTDPGNVGVAGLPANAVSRATVETVSGTVLGRTVSVRFTPASFDFAYGDGTTATTATGGADWAALGQKPFTPTPTSHVYATRGTYTLAVTVRYAAEVDTGAGWRAIPGTVEGAPSRQEIRIYAARTALVGRTCAENPTGPGC
ncbi:hypothetical protein [Arenibacterium sp. S380]|uniref:hypothetical protein n=2 Tax=Bacteria TaxID=2 RepID=UPI003C7C05BD